MENETPTLQEKAAGLHQTLSRMLATGLSLLVLALILGSMAMLNMDNVVEQLELKTYDLRSQIQWSSKEHSPSPDVLILQFDDPSLNTLSDEFGVWPWPRDVHGRMIQFLNQIGVRTLLYDIMFVSQRKGDEVADQFLADTFHKSNNVYLSMNLGNDLHEYEQLGKYLTPHDIALLKPLSIEVVSELSKAPQDSPLQLQKDEEGEVFFKNNHMTFDYYRSIMPSLINKGSHIGIINHGADADGVSRSNPLFFRFKYKAFIKTKALPIKQQDTYWVDTENNRVDAEGYLYAKTRYLPIRKQNNGTYLDSEPNAPKITDAEGYLLDEYGHLKYLRENHKSILYFPYLGLRAALDLKYPNEKITLHLSKDGHLKFKDYDIPLTSTGDFLVNWHNVNLSREGWAKSQIELSRYIDAVQKNQKLLTDMLAQPANKDPAMHNAIQAEMRQNLANQEKAQGYLKQYSLALKNDYTPQPYAMVSAWKIIGLMKKRDAGRPYSKEDMELINTLKNKIIFIGATAVATYDIKNTSISSTMPGVMLQANLFDNLWQNKGLYIRRVPPNVNFTLTLILSLVAAGCTFKMRSALAGLLATANIALIYTLFTILAFQSMHLWVNLAMPMVCLVISITITFMLKYFLRNQDYEKTYAMATTDSMTNLYNHRFFQEHMRQSIEQSNRFKHKFSLLLIDIDFFKRFNDTYGHQAGDEVLRQVARKLKKTVRNVDIVARYGGEEMAIILDRANEEEALAVAHKIVKAIAEEAYPIAEGVNKHISISCGVATYPTHGDSPSQMIEFADAGLYRAKHNGRNQVGAQYDTLPPDDGMPEGHAAA